MQYGLYISAAGLQAQEYRQNVFANNLANSSTVGFKRDLAVIQSRRNPANEDPALAAYRVPELLHQGGGVTAAPTTIDLTPATLNETGNKTDLALQGPGFFSLQGDGPGRKLLTRNGQFLINDKNELVTAAEGRQVLDTAGKSIVLDPALPVAVGGDGQIRQGDTTVAQLGVVNVPNPGDLRKLGKNLLAARPGAALEPMPSNTQVRQGNLENSGVEPITEMANMLAGQRAFEANAKLITYQDTMLQELNTVGHIA